MVLKYINNKNLDFITNLAQATSNDKIVYFAIEAYMGDDGYADLQYVLVVAKSIGDSMEKELVVIDKVKATIQKELDRRNLDLQFHNFPNSDFLKEGAVISGFMKPDIVSVGSERDYDTDLIKHLYHPFCMSHNRFISMGVRSKR
jgi:UDPglucose 6-dehydrogenase